MAARIDGRSTVFFGLGSNRGDRVQNLQRALTFLHTVVQVDAVSAVYETVPWGKNQDQATFLNMCVRATSGRTLSTLLHCVKAFEKAADPSRLSRWGPIGIDVDVLLYDDVVTKIGKSYVPHRTVESCAFVLVPLAEIAPDWLHPQRQLPISTLCASVGHEGVVYFGRISTSTVELAHDVDGVPLLAVAEGEGNVAPDEAFCFGDVGVDAG